MTRASKSIAWILSIGVCLGAVHVWSIDGISGVMLTLFRAETRYAPGYTDDHFRAVTSGMSYDQVAALLGRPLGETWTYPGGCDVYVRDRKVEATVLQPCKKRGVFSGERVQDLQARIGLPDSILWRYSDSPTGSHYRERLVYFEHDRVTRAQAGVYLD